MRPDLVPVDDLVTVDEIARRLRWSVSTCLKVVTGRGGRFPLKFPKPLVGKAKHGVWLWTDVKAWHDQAVPKSVYERERESHMDSTPFKQPNWNTGRRSA